MSFNLRKRTRISYYEPEEPNFDEYIYCEQCADFVYDYCAVHGPLLVVPDNKIFDSNNKRLHVIDAADSSHSNWMRYVNCSRHYKEQNLIAYQFRGQLYYRTIKIIPRYTELLVFYGSEFANALHIDLKKYNSAKYYNEIISTTEKALHKNQDDCMQEDYLTEEHFHFIDQESEDENSLKTMKSTKYISDDSFDKIKENIKTNDTSQAKYECDICQKTMIHKNNLKKHLLRHLNTRKYNCEHCLYKTNEKSHFNKHLGYHTNSFEFSCGKCSFKTNYAKSLKRHSLCHDKLQLRPKSCQLCDFKTGSLTDFRTHMVEHKEDIFKCVKCSYYSYSKRNLSKHTLRKRH